MRSDRRSVGVRTQAEADAAHQPWITFEQEVSMFVNPSPFLQRVREISITDKTDAKYYSVCYKPGDNTIHRTER